MTSVSNQIRQTYQNRVLERRLRAGFKTQKEFAAEIDWGVDWMIFMRKRETRISE